jgi:hypothetical protein
VVAASQDACCTRQTSTLNISASCSDTNTSLSSSYSEFQASCSPHNSRLLSSRLFPQASTLQLVKACSMSAFCHRSSYSSSAISSKHGSTASATGSTTTSAHCTHSYSAWTSSGKDYIHIRGARFYGYHGVLPEVGMGGCSGAAIPAGISLSGHKQQQQK